LFADKCYASFAVWPAHGHCELPCWGRAASYWLLGIYGQKWKDTGHSEEKMNPPPLFIIIYLVIQTAGPHHARCYSTVPCVGSGPNIRQSVW
jgi:hypothetical protein